MPAVDTVPPIEYVDADQLDRAIVKQFSWAVDRRRTYFARANAYRGYEHLCWAKAILLKKLTMESIPQSERDAVMLILYKDGVGGWL